MPERFGSPLLALCGVIASVFHAGCTNGSSCASIAASGYVEATQVRVATKVGGIVDAVAVREGDRVRKGAVVARIDTIEVSLALAVARADRAQAEADLRLRLAGSRPEEIREAEAMAARAQAELASAERDLARMQALLDAGSGTAKARDDARTRRDIALASREAAREQLLRRRNGSRPEEIEAARARAEAASARVDQLTQRLRDTRIESPLDGIVTEKLVEAGELVSAQSALVVITDLAHPWLNVYVGERDLSRIRVGDSATVRVDGGETRTGVLSYISDQAEFTPRNVQTREERERLVYKVKVTLPNEDGFFKPGMPAEAALSAGRPAAGGRG